MNTKFKMTAVSVMALEQALEHLGNFGRIHEVSAEKSFDVTLHSLAFDEAGGIIGDACT